jgi:hypothetical protein
MNNEQEKLFNEYKEIHIQLSDLSSILLNDFSRMKEDGMTKADMVSMLETYARQYNNILKLKDYQDRVFSFVASEIRKLYE